MPIASAVSWLKIASLILLIGLGFGFAIAAFPPASGLITLMVDVLFWPIDGAQSMAAPETRIMLAIGGGITAGWGVTIWLIADRLMPLHPELARSILLPGIAVWFVTDSTCSMLAGAPLNVPANMLFLAVFLWPLLRMKHQGAPAAG
jgi:hypothetical protein